MTDRFNLFIEQVFTLYNTLAASSNREYVLGASRRMLQLLHRYSPVDDDETINIETAIELFDELVRKAGGS